MRTMARIGRGIAAVTLVTLVAACSGGTGSTNPTSGTAQTTAAATTNAALPTQSVCDVFSKETVSKAIGVPVYSSDDKDVLAGAQPTVCMFYTDTRQVDNVEIHWMLIKDAIWEQQLSGLGTFESGGMKTVSSRYPGLGDDAIRGTSNSDMESTLGYQVLLKQRGLVVDIEDASVPSVTDGALLNLIKTVVIPTVNKL